MEKQHGAARYWTSFVEDNQSGCSGFQLHCECFGTKTLVGQTTYWDVGGCFVFGTFDGNDVPVEIVLAAIAEAKEKILTA